MALLARELSIAYGSYTVGGAQTGRVLEAWHVVEEGYETAVVEFTFLLRSSSESAFATAVAAAEAAFRNPNQALTVTQGSETLKSYSHSSNTGMNGRPSIRKVADKADTGRSRRYRARVEFDLPADQGSTSGRRLTRTSIAVAYEPSRRRTVTLSGSYTALSGTAARAQFTSAFSTWATSTLNGLGGTYKRLEDPSVSTDDQDKILTFTAVYEEDLGNLPGSGDADVRNESLVITRDNVSPGDTNVNGKQVQRLITLTASYEAWIDAETTEDLKGKWNSLRGGVISKLNDIMNGGSVSIVQETPGYDLKRNRITATVVALGSTSLGVVEYRETVSEPKMSGKQAVGVWEGGPFAKHVFQGPGTWQRRITQTYLTFGTRPPFSPASLQPPAGMQKFEVADEPTVTPVTRGLSGGQVFNLSEVTRTLTLEFYTTPTASGAGNTVVGETTGDPFIDAITRGASSSTGTSGRFNQVR